MEAKWNFPNCLGSIDGKHVTIQCPPKSGSTYFNYKKSFSIVLLAVCDGGYRFTYVDIGHMGSESDGGIFARSQLKEILENSTHGIPSARPVGSAGTMSYFIVGDEAFPLKPYMMRPYPKRGMLQYRHKAFNYRLSRARRLIENSFGILAARWRILRRPFQASVKNANRIVQACVALHNFLLKESPIS
ncbi:uncharacterized protein LOC135376804, partial [Ornithodoros turicata]|uniref:uncharacterized protein LOC135376804 n=1 Tax=Ornithodoros turicata TaxID=34597 RepID=UPI0031397741